MGGGALHASPRGLAADGWQRGPDGDSLGAPWSCHAWVLSVGRAPPRAGRRYDATRCGTTRVQRGVGAAPLGLRPRGPRRTSPAGPTGLGGRRQVRSTVPVPAGVLVGKLRRQVRLEGGLRAPQPGRRRRAGRYAHTVALGAHHRLPVGVGDGGGCRPQGGVRKALAHKAPRDVRPRCQDEAQRCGPPSVPLGEGHRPKAGERPRRRWRGPEQAAVQLVRTKDGAHHRKRHREACYAKEGIPRRRSDAVRVMGEDPRQEPRSQPRRGENEVPVGGSRREEERPVGGLTQRQAHRAMTRASHRREPPHHAGVPLVGPVVPGDRHGGEEGLTPHLKLQPDAHVPQRRLPQRRQLAL